MKSQMQFAIINPSVKDSPPWLPLRSGLLLVALALAWLGLSPQARAVCQEGCLTNFNTALGEDALFNNTGLSNTATGWGALFLNTIGNSNTAIGVDALHRQ